MSKQSMDAHRDGAVLMSVGTAQEGALGEVFATEDAWYMTKPNAIYKIQLADHIDPLRHNLNVPNTQQKIYSVGYASELVCRSVLTARALITRDRFGEELHKAALAIGLRILDSLIVMRSIQDDFVSVEEAALSGLDARRREDRSVAIPSVGDIGGRIKQFVQNSEHCCQDLFRIGCLIYQVEKNWVDGLVLAVRQRHQDLTNEDFEIFESLVKFMKFIRNARHCVEHPSQDQRIAAFDFRLNAEAQVVRPTVQIVHRLTPEPEVPLRVFFEDINESMLNVVDSFIACLCAFNIEPFGIFPVQVMPLAEEKRRNKLIRFGYAIGINGEWQPLQ